MSAKETRSAMTDYVLKCPEFLYSYTPAKSTRYVFKDKVVIGLTDAFFYAVSLDQDSKK